MASNRVMRIGGMAMLNDANASKGIDDAISLCTHGPCLRKSSCGLRAHLLDLCADFGVFMPITGCRSYLTQGDYDLPIGFGEYNDDAGEYVNDVE